MTNKDIPHSSISEDSTNLTIINATSHTTRFT